MKFFEIENDSSGRNHEVIWILKSDDGARVLWVLMSIEIVALIFEVGGLARMVTSAGDDSRWMPHDSMETTDGIVLVERASEMPPIDPQQQTWLDGGAFPKWFEFYVK